MRGIDAQIKRRMMQDPRRLQQKYRQSRDILDLIALQMIKSEKDQKKKDMMLKMQDSPATIKQQMEQDLVRQTKADLVKQTGGILALQQARQQKNLQKAASGKPKPPMAGIAQPFNRLKPKTPTMANPLAVGLARAPAPNMKGMTRRAAQGGIVGFHTGNQVTAMGGNHNPNDHTHLTGGPNTHGYGQIVSDDSLADMFLTQLKKDYAKFFPPVPPAYVSRGIEGGDPEISQPPTKAVVKPKEQVKPEIYGPPPPPPPVPGSGIELIDPDILNKYDTIKTEIAKNTTPVSGTNILADTMKADADLMKIGQDYANINLQDKQKAAQENAQKQLGMTADERAVFQKNIEAREAKVAEAEDLFKEAYGNKDKNKMDDLISFLVGAGGTAGIGETLGRGTEASRRNKKARLNAMAKARTNINNLFDKAANSSEALINKDLDIRQKAFDAGTKDKEIFAALKGKGLEIVGDLTVQRLKGLSQDAVNMFNLNLAQFKEKGMNDRVRMETEARIRVSKVDNTVKIAVSNLEGELAKERMILDDRLNRAIEAGNQIEAAEIRLAQAEKTMAGIKTGYAKIYDDIISGFQRDLSTFPDPETKAAIQEIITYYEGQKEARIGEAIVGLEADVERLRLRLQQLGGGGASDIVNQAMSIIGSPQNLA